MVRKALAGGQAQAAAGAEREDFDWWQHHGQSESAAVPHGVAGRCTEAALPHDKSGGALRVCMAAQTLTSGRCHLIVGGD